jgi:hypothetical protein
MAPYPLPLLTSSSPYDTYHPNPASFSHKPLFPQAFSKGSFILYIHIVLICPEAQAGDDVAGVVAAMIAAVIRNAVQNISGHST